MALEREFEYYLDNQDRLVKDYNGMYIVIKDETVLGSYSSEDEAITSTLSSHELGTFLVQYCEPGTESYTQIFHSRVAFA